MPKFYSAKPPALVTRYGTGTFIGAAVVMQGGRPTIVYNTDEVVAIPDAEIAAYSREYLTHERDGALVVPTEADYLAWLEAEQAAHAVADQPAEASSPAEAAVAPEEQPAEPAPVARKNNSKLEK